MARATSAISKFMFASFNVRGGQRLYLLGTRKCRGRNLIITGRRQAVTSSDTSAPLEPTLRAPHWQRRAIQACAQLQRAAFLGQLPSASLVITLPLVQWGTTWLSLIPP